MSFPYQLYCLKCWVRQLHSKWLLVLLLIFEILQYISNLSCHGWKLFDAGFHHMFKLCKLKFFFCYFIIIGHISINTFESWILNNFSKFLINSYWLFAIHNWVLMMIWHLLTHLILMFWIWIRLVTILTIHILKIWLVFMLFLWFLSFLRIFWIHSEYIYNNTFYS